MITAKVIADSKNQFGNRITTMIVTFPRIILSEFNTHRMFSRNSASSRAIPFEKMLKSVNENPFIPIAWQKDHKGMQGVEYITNEEHLKTIEEDWLSARNESVHQATRLSRGFQPSVLNEELDNEDCVTKQLCNRLLEPFMWHTVIVTTTEWENFFALRCPKYNLYGKTEGTTNYQFRSKKDAMKACFDERVTKQNELEWLQCNEGQAEIHMMALAEAMWDAYNESVPKELKEGEWHIPFGDNIFYDGDAMMSVEQHQAWRVKIATARCARVSYTTIEMADKGLKEADFKALENDIKLHDRLAESGHWSPFEHCARAMNDNEYKYSYGNCKLGEYGIRHEEGWSGNFRGFIQYRKTFNNENITKHGSN